MKKNQPERWHGAHHYSNKIHLFFIFFLFFTIFTFLFFYVESHSEKLNYRVADSQTTITPKPTQKFCSEEALICPDGTILFKNPPTCEFTKCPVKGGEI